MAFRIRYHEDALADLETVFDWSREKHPETTEQFASGLFTYLDLLQAFPNMGTRVS
jgi:plasmid stabilization system protein ParE